MRRPLAVLALALVAACLPPDEQTLPLGGVAFVMTTDERTRSGIAADTVADGWQIEFERVVISFKQMTIGKRNDTGDACSYRGRGARQNVVFDVREDIEESFNGILPTDCPDVGVVLGAPDDATTLGKGITIDDVKRLLVPTPAIAFVDAVATRRKERYTVNLRFEAEKTTTRWGGCSDTRKGVLVLPNARDTIIVPFSIVPIFTAGKGSSPVYFLPFALADQLVTPDHVVTMQELDELPVAALGANAGPYRIVLGNDTTRTTMGDYVREQFREVFGFGLGGKCNGLDPGSTE